MYSLSINKINILFLFWGKKGGGAKYSLEIVKELAKRDDIQLHLSLSSYCVLLEEFQSLQLPGFIVDTYSSIKGFLKTWFFRKKELRTLLYQYFVDKKIDFVIIGMDFFWSSVILDAAKMAGAKSVLVVHEPEPHPNEPFFMTQFKKFGLYKGITGADQIVTLTDHVKFFIQTKYNIRSEWVSVIPHGIFEYYKTAIPKQLPGKPEPVRILYFGRIEYYKGLDILLKAFKIIEEKTDHVKLEIWGSGNLEQYADLINNVENIHIENRWIDEEEIINVFKNSHICILPYRQASQSGIVGIASRAGMPIVACPAIGLQEQLSDCGAIVSDYFTPGAVAESILKVINSPDLYYYLSVKSITYAEKLSWERIAGMFANLVHSDYEENEFKH